MLLDYTLADHGDDSNIDLNRSRYTAGWNYLCVAFIPGAKFPVKEEEIILDISLDDTDVEKATKRNFIFIIW